MVAITQFSARSALGNASPSLCITPIFTNARSIISFTFNRSVIVLNVLHFPQIFIITPGYHHRRNPLEPLLSGFTTSRETVGDLGTHSATHEALVTHLDVTVAVRADRSESLLETYNIRSE